MTDVTDPTEIAEPSVQTDDQTLVLRRPDDWHVHFRDGAMLALVADYTARQFARAIIMPNLVPPVTTVAAAEAYRTRILAALPDGRAFTPLMTAYLTDEIDPDEIEAGYRDPSIWFNGFAQLESTGTSIAAETGAVTLKMDGKRRYAVFLNNPGLRPATIELRFTANDEVIHEAQLDFSEAD